MNRLTRTIPPREIAKWCSYAIVLLAPGSFVVLPLLWLARHWPARTTRLTTASPAALELAHTELRRGHGGL